MADKPIYRSARIRAAIAAIMPHATEPVTIQQMQRHPAIQEIDATIGQVTSVVADLHKRGDLKRVYVTRKDEPNTKYAYELPKGEAKLPAETVALLNKPAKPLVRPVVSALPDVRLDIIKSSGRLRIEFRGLRVEIGAVD